MYLYVFMHILLYMYSDGIVYTFIYRYITCLPVLYNEFILLH